MRYILLVGALTALAGAASAQPSIPAQLADLQADKPLLNAIYSYAMTVGTCEPKMGVAKAAEIRLALKKYFSFKPSSTWERQLIVMGPKTVDEMFVKGQNYPNKKSMSAADCNDLMNEGYKIYRTEVQMSEKRHPNRLPKAATLSR